MTLLEVDGLNVSYGLSKVLHGVSFTVDRGELVSLVGRNGVGKSTTMRSVMGLVVPRSGTVRWKGRDITRRAPHLNSQDGMGYVPEDRRIFASLTVWENLDVARLPARDGAEPWDEERVFDMFPDLGTFRDRAGGLLSGGQQQMLTIGRTLMGNPELILLDEPSEGIAPVVVESIRLKIDELKATGVSIVLAEQNLDFVLSLSDRIYVLEKGSVVAEGPTRRFRDEPDILERFMSV